MKKLFFACTVFVFTFSIQAQKLDDDQYKKLVKARQYDSAYQLLEKADPKNGNPEIVVKKVDLALNYFVQSMMHRMFSFKDLEEGEELMELRGANGSFSIYPMEIDLILDSLIKIYPSNGSLYQALGNFYYEVHLKYGQNWFESNDELLRKMHLNSMKAIELDAADYITYYAVGYFHNLNEAYSKAIDYYLKSIEADPSYPTSYYNLAICYLYEGKAKQGVPYAQKSIELYTDVEYKADAARVTAALYKNLQDYANAEKYYLQSDQILSDNYYTLNQLLEVQLLQGKLKDADKTAQLFFALDPSNPRICSDLVEIYSITEKGDELVPFLGKMSKKNEGNHEVLGNIYFHIGSYFLRTEKLEKAKENFKIARYNFEKVFEPGHAVFQQIDGVLNEN